MSLPTNRMPGDIIQAVDINQIAEAVNQLSDSVTSEPGGTTDHAALTNRDAADQHPIGSVTGLQSVLDGKAATGHGHTIEDVEYLQIALNNKAEAGHGHPIADVTGLQTALNGKQAAGSYALATHTHDDRYYTESEVNAALSGKANTSHTHDDRYYTESEVNSALAGKANTSHSHPVTDLTATGTPDETTFLRGDGRWETPEGGAGVLVSGTPVGGWLGSPHLTGGIQNRVLGAVPTSVTAGSRNAPMPIPIFEPMTIDAVGVFCGSGTPNSNTAKFRIYGVSGDNYSAGSLLGESSSFTGSSNGTLTLLLNTPIVVASPTWLLVSLFTDDAAATDSPVLKWQQVAYGPGWGRRFQNEINAYYTQNNALFFWAPLVMLRRSA